MGWGKGRRALVTGASSGIGLAFAEALAARGLDLILVARSQDKLDDLAARLSRDHRVRAEVLVVDLAQPGAALLVHQGVQSLGGKVDLLVNNAGFGRWGEFLDFDRDTYASMIQVNVTTVVDLCHLFLPDLIADGGLGIINVGSTSSFFPVPYAGVYAATKAFILSFTEALAGEYSDTGLRFLALCPGGTDTGFAKVANPRALRFPGASPGMVVADALRAFARGKTSVISPWVNFLNAAVLPRLLPRWALIGLMGAVFRRVNAPRRRQEPG